MGDAEFRGSAGFSNLIAVAAFLSFPTFNHLPRSFLPFKFGIPNAHAWLSGGIPVGMASPDTHDNFGRKQNEHFKEIDCGHGPGIGPVRYP
jgi:hypothetical protein